jgi:hypothetical protein
MAETLKDTDLKDFKNTIVDRRVIEVGEERAVRYLSHSRMNSKNAHEAYLANKRAGAQTTFSLKPTCKTPSAFASRKSMPEF